MKWKSSSYVKFQIINEIISLDETQEHAPNIELPTKIYYFHI